MEKWKSGGIDAAALAALEAGLAATRVWSLLISVMAQRAARRALDRLDGHGYAFPDRRVRVLATPERATVGDRIAERISGAQIARDLLEHPYYNGGIRYQIDATSTRGVVPLIDGGTFDWVATLAANSKMIFVATGMGSQLAAHLYQIGRAHV